MCPRNNVGYHWITYANLIIIVVLSIGWQSVSKTKKEHKPAEINIFYDQVVSNSWHNMHDGGQWFNFICVPVPLVE